jgi:hypothetical protein
MLNNRPRSGLLEYFAFCKAAIKTLHFAKIKINNPVINNLTDPEASHPGLLTLESIRQCFGRGSGSPRSFVPFQPALCKYSLFLRLYRFHVPCPGTRTVPVHRG